MQYNPSLLGIFHFSQCCCCYAYFVQLYYDVIIMKMSVCVQHVRELRSYFHKLLDIYPPGSSESSGLRYILAGR